MQFQCGTHGTTNEVPPFLQLSGATPHVDTEEVGELIGTSIKYNTSTCVQSESVKHIFEHQKLEPRDKVTGTANRL